MQLYIITIERKEKILFGNDSVEDVLRNNFIYVKLTESAYLVKSQNSSVEIRNFLVENAGVIERLFVGEMASTAAWKNMISDNEYIKGIFNNE